MSRNAAGSASGGGVHLCVAVAASTAILSRELRIELRRDATKVVVNWAAPFRSRCEGAAARRTAPEARTAMRHS